MKSRKLKKNKFTEVVDVVTDILMVPVIILAIITCISTFSLTQNNQLPSFGGYRIAHVLSESMLASGFEKEDKVVVKEVDVTNLERGDIIAFYYYPKVGNTFKMGTVTLKNTITLEEKKKGDSIITSNDMFKQAAKDGALIYFHEVVNIAIDKEGVVWYQTKGSSNKTADYYWTRQDLVVGKYVEKTAWLTPIFSFMLSVRGIAIIVIIPSAVLFMIQLYPFWDYIDLFALESKIIKKQIKVDDELCLKKVVGIGMKVKNKLTVMHMYSEEILHERERIFYILWHMEWEKVRHSYEDRNKNEFKKIYNDYLRFFNDENTFYNVGLENINLAPIFIYVKEEDIKAEEKQEQVQPLAMPVVTRLRMFRVQEVVEDIKYKEAERYVMYAEEKEREEAMVKKALKEREDSLLLKQMEEVATTSIDDYNGFMSLVLGCQDQRDTITFKAQLSRSFTARLIQSTDKTKSFYSDIKNYMIGFKNVRSRISWGCETFSYKRKCLVKLAIRGKTLNAFIAIDEQSIEDLKYKADVSSAKKHASVPCQYKVNGDRRVKYFKELFNLFAQEYKMVAGNEDKTDYAEVYKYKTDTELNEQNLIKIKMVKAGKSFWAKNDNKELMVNSVEQSQVVEDENT